MIEKNTIVEQERYIMGVFSHTIVGMKRGSKGGKKERCILGGQQE